MANLNKTVTGEIFIIPNHAGLVKDYLFKEEELERATSLCKANGKEFDENNDWIVETWFLSEEVGSDNIPDHGFSVNINDKKYRIFSGELSRHIPAKLLPSKEGEPVSITFENIDAYEMNHEDVRKRFHDNPEKLDITLNLTAAQEKYRYGNFGKFEEVLSKVCC
jgi:hypothetical protein